MCFLNNYLGPWTNVLVISNLTFKNYLCSVDKNLALRKQFVSNASKIFIQFQGDMAKLSIDVNNTLNTAQVLFEV
jgi:hypothetical protein